MFRILIADHHAVVRRGLKQIVATTADIVVADEATRGSEVLDKLRAHPVDVLLLDITMPNINGIDLIRHVRAEQFAPPILVFSLSNEAQIAWRALRAGARGYVTKDSEPDIWLAAIRKLARGGRFVDPALVDAILFETHSGNPSPHEILSDRELRMLRMLAAGTSTSEVADAFALSPRAVSDCTIHLMQKIGFGSHMELIRYAIKHGMTAE